MQDDCREFEASDLDGAIGFVRALADEGATTIWLETWTGRGWELAYGSDPDGAERFLSAIWNQRSRLRVRLPGETRDA